MPKLQWDQSGSRIFERGVDQGVLYLPNGNVVPWNGLTSVVETSGQTIEPIYFDGQKISDNATSGDFSGTIKAITYPDEFLELEGLGIMVAGIYAADQAPKTFGFSYRTLIGSDTDIDMSGYKIHVIYNVTAIASDKNFLTFSNDAALTEFEWTITSVPEEVTGFRPTSHIVIDSRYAPPDLLSDLETWLYGGETANPQLPVLADLVELILGYFVVEIIDNKDGTWTAISNLPDYILMLTLDQFQINNVDAVSVDANTYQISSTRY